MKKVLLASNNAKKIKEIKEILGDNYEVFALKDLNLDVDIPENENTFEGNALVKANFLSQHFEGIIIADDSGLEVEALNMEPGVYSARYAGAQRSDEDNMQKLLAELEIFTNRKAQFRTVIALIKDELSYVFEGKVSGEITTSKQGDKGFGYDPIFMPEGYDKTFAQMTADEKNTISHRGQAVKQLAEFLSR